MSKSDVEELTATVSKQVTEQALALCTQTAYDIAIKRMQEFESVWIQRIERIQNVVGHLADPKFNLCFVTLI